MKRQMLLILASLTVIVATQAKPAAAARKFDCDDLCNNSDQCATEGCILCVHAIIPDSSKCG
jgi:hypothetical protein